MKHSKKEDLVLISISLIFALISALFFRKLGIEPKQIYLYSAMIFVVFGAIICLIYFLFIKKCDSCKKRGGLNLILEIEDHSSFKLKPLQIGYFCTKCRRTETWRKNPYYSQYKDHKIALNFFAQVHF